MEEERENVPSVATSSHHPSPSPCSSYTSLLTVHTLTKDLPASGPFAFCQNHFSLRCSQAPKVSSCGSQLKGHLLAKARPDLSSKKSNLPLPILSPYFIFCITYLSLA